MDIPDFEDEVSGNNLKKEYTIKLYIFLQLKNIPYSPSIYKKAIGDLDV